jgi:uncharacterized protein (TIGR02145 family)
VRPDNTVSVSATPNLCINASQNTTIHSTTGATGISMPVGLPPGVSAGFVSNTVRITGTPTQAGTFNYSIPLTGGCGDVEAQGAITITDLVGCQVCGPGGSVLTFSCYNLGAVATSDPYTQRWELNGAYYQWGRAVVAAAGPTGPSSAGANAGAIAGWNTTAAPIGAWTDGSKTANDPCPSGFRVPTKAQWDAVLNTSLNPTRTNLGTWISDYTNYSSGLRIGSGAHGIFLPAVGWREASDGSLASTRHGDYWCSTRTGNIAWALYTSNTFSYTGEQYGNPILGFSIRCIAE